mmetsp:Transcript_16574/g.38296  ORF Transcript_16574/g.38296 Transcript_16574/m.38296 type:complete len:849 (+) Transcript_16574:176-2722(+)|eukprot:CAMPEP_0197187552 /NCGR_PEP_ID=MMETSP1423-20130617/16072_1 /TAXON_ID=476441 /ORGANISM="Pseudo-nitzschia heimii, Strain UNC1101" /LENGTH=848 /DNA_ID=CAMNT_0042639159 /DNA_START=111 /DNA_END=2657 /DNA_ORIENTATION=+
MSFESSDGEEQPLSMGMSSYSATSRDETADECTQSENEVSRADVGVSQDESLYDDFASGTEGKDVSSYVHSENELSKEDIVDSQDESSGTEVKDTSSYYATSAASVEYVQSNASEVTEARSHLSPRNKMKKKTTFRNTQLKVNGALSAVSDESRTKRTSNHSRNVPRILVNHQRVPGGAAAKLIGRKVSDSYEFVNDGDDALEVVAPVDELIKSRDIAKAEFSVGSSKNTRYHAPVRSNSSHDVPLPNNKSLPRILDREEVFHENPAAAIVSILTPSNKPGNTQEIVDILTTRSSDVHLSPSSSNMLPQTKSSFTNPFSLPTKKFDVSTVKSTGSDVHRAVEDAMETITSTGKNPLVQHLLTKKTERHLATIKDRMKDPSKNLTQLMEAIASPPNGIFSRHYMVRRKNACGALKVLTANAAHRVNICWTLGILPALTSVLEDSGPDTIEEKYPSPSIRREFLEARKSALSSLMYLALPQCNKLPIFHCPRLVASLVRVIEQDNAEAQRSSCNVLAHLSKSKENRVIMAQVPGLLDAITSVIEPKKFYVDCEDGLLSLSEGSENSEVDIVDKPSNAEREMSFSEKSPAETMSEEFTLSDGVADLCHRYDNDPDPFIHGARQNVFALLMHLVKEKDNSYILARHAYLITTLVSITKLQESKIQDIGLKIFANLSRHRSNSKILVFKMKDVVPAIILATKSNNDASRKYAFYALQNFSQDKPCRQQLASIKDLLPAVCSCIRNADDPEEKLAALHTLKNLTDEPANLIPMTNTPECFATLIQVAHASDDSITETMQYVGCDALSTLSHWFRSIATSGHRVGTVKRNMPESVIAKNELFVPSQSVLSWEPWQ